MQRSCGDFSPEKQKRVFEDLIKNSYKGIPGVTYVQGNTRSASFAVLMIFTHGNEPGGLAAASALLDDHDVRDRLTGNVMITVNNIEAGSKYFLAKTAEEKSACRGVDMNMNRIPEDILDRKSGSNEPYEIRRLLQLMPLLRDASLGLDIHSLGQPGNPMIIDTKGKKLVLDELSDSMDVETRITNIIAHMKGYSVGCLVGGLKKGAGIKHENLTHEVPAIALEVGPHEEPTAMDFARKLTLSTLLGAGYLDGERTENTTTQRTYQTIDSFKFPSMAYQFVRPHNEFGFIRKGEVIAKGDGDDIVAEQDCHTLFGIAPTGLKLTNEAHLPDERMFLALPPQNRQRFLREPVFKD